MNLFLLVKSGQIVRLRIKILLPDYDCKRLPICTHRNFLSVLCDAHCAGD